MPQDLGSRCCHGCLKFHAGTLEVRGVHLHADEAAAQLDRGEASGATPHEGVEYDGANEKVRFVGDAKMRVVRSSGPPDEASAAVITYDQRTDTIVFEGGPPPSVGAPPGRARLVFIPRNAEAAASEPAK